MKKTLIVLLLVSASCSAARLAPSDERRGLMLLEPHELTTNRSFSRSFPRIHHKHKYSDYRDEFKSISLLAGTDERGLGVRYCDAGRNYWISVMAGQYTVTTSEFIGQHVELSAGWTGKLYQNIDRSYQLRVVLGAGVNYYGRLHGDFNSMVLFPVSPKAGIEAILFRRIQTGVTFDPLKRTAVLQIGKVF